MDEPAQHTLCGESLQVSTRLTQTLSKTFDVSNSESATDKAVEIDAAGDQVSASFAVVEPTAIRQRELIKNFGLEASDRNRATTSRSKGAGPCFISITHQASAGRCLRLGNEHHRTGSPRGQRNRLHATTLRGVSRRREELGPTARLRTRAGSAGRCRTHHGGCLWIEHRGSTEHHCHYRSPRHAAGFGARTAIQYGPVEAWARRSQPARPRRPPTIRATGQ